VRKEIIGDCTLYLGDCLEILPSIDAVDCIVTDPPYLLTYGGCHTSLGGKLSSEVYDNKGGIVDCNIEWDDFMPLLSNILPSGHAYIMCNNRHVQNLLVSAEKAGFRFHNLLIWDKISPTPNRWYMKNCEFIGFFYKGKAEFINDCGSKQLIRVPLPMDDFHPTVKPIPLMEHYIKNSTEKQQTVLDPFMGSGTSGIACINLGRKFIGIEKEEKYFDLSCERLRKLIDNMQGKLL